MPKLTHALVVMLYDTTHLGFAEHQCVLPFESEAAAEAFAVQRLVDQGQLRVHDGGQYSHADDDNDEPALHGQREALECWQEGLVSMEYYHIVPLVDPN